MAAQWTAQMIEAQTPNQSPLVEDLTNFKTIFAITVLQEYFRKRYS
jgi:hypothetical protein